MRIRNTINPVAKALLQSERRRSQIVPDKKKYNRKKEQDRENKARKDND